MKKIFFNILAICTILITACNNNAGKNEPEKHDMNTMSKDSTSPAVDDNEMKAVVVTYTNVDVKIAASFKEMVDHYLHIKNALTNDNGNDAASGAKAMEAVIKNLDKSLLTAEQKKDYDKNEEELKEHAEHIAKNSDRVEHQRSHFAMLSEVMYELVKAFGGGRALYHDHCPMYDENKGAMWLSEIKEVKNPYYGSKMLTCGKTVETIKQ